MTDIRNALTTTLIDGAEVAHTGSGGDGEPLRLMHGGACPAARWDSPKDNWRTCPSCAR